MRKIYLVFLFLAPVFTGHVAGQPLQNVLKVTVIHNGFQDETVIRFLNDATTGYDGNYEAFKFFSPNPAVPSLFTRTDNGWELAINALPDIAEKVTVPVFAKIPVTAQGTISFIEEGEFDPGIKIMCNIGGVLMDLDSVNAMQQFLQYDTCGCVPLMELIFLPATDVTSMQMACKNGNEGTAFIERPGDTAWHLSLTDQSGSVLFADSVFNQGILLDSLPAGIYMVESSAMQAMWYDTLIINQTPVINPSIVLPHPDSLLPNTLVQLEGTSLVPATFSWKFNTIPVDSGAAITIQLEEGLHVIELIAADGNGCIEKEMREIHVQGPVSDFMQLALPTVQKIFVSDGNIVIRGIEAGSEWHLYQTNGAGVNRGITTTGETIIPGGGLQGVFVLAVLRRDGKIITEKINLAGY